MDLEKLKKRIYAFYFAGTINLFLGCYVLLYGGGVEPSTRRNGVFTTPARSGNFQRPRRFR